MPYTAFDSTVPAGTQTGSAFASSANANDCALRDAILGGMFGNFAYAQSGGTAEEPTTQTWRSANGAGAIILRATNTWSSGYCTQTLWELSTDSGVTYSAIYTEGRTFDGSGNLTATNNGGSIISWFHQWVGKFKALRTSFNSHAAATGTAVHGLGSIATQSSAAVALTGGAIDGIVVGATTKALGYFKQAREVHSSVAFGATTTLDWSAAASFDFTATGTGAATLAFSNMPASGIVAAITVEITNGGLRTWTYPAGTKWAGGSAPSLSSAGRDRLTFVTRDGGTTIDGYLTGKGMA